MPSFPFRFTCAGALLALSLAAAAQGTAPPAKPASQPASRPGMAVAVSPKDAAEASEKAVPRSDVGTLVKTGPTVADKAQQASGDKKHHAKRAHRAASAASAASAGAGG